MERQKKIDLVCLGNLVLDVFAKPIDHFPIAGGGEYFDTLEIHPGGCAYNTGVDASRLGLQVGIQGKIGNDQFGKTMLNYLLAENIDVSGICLSPNTNTGYSFVMVSETGQRRYYHTVGANSTFAISDVSLDSIKQARAFHVAGASLLPALDGEPTVELLKTARKNGVLTSLDPVVKKGIKKQILLCLPYLDIFLPNNDESLLITGFSTSEDQLQFYLDNGAGIVGIKQGENGVLISDGKNRFKLGVYTASVVDTCGAGDAFVAEFIYGHLAGWNLMKTAMFASATAAFCVQSIGATTAIPNADDILDFMHSRTIT